MWVPPVDQAAFSEGSDGWGGGGGIPPVDPAAFPEGSDSVSEEVSLEVSPMMWDLCLVSWEVDTDQEVGWVAEWAVAACQPWSEKG